MDFRNGGTVVFKRENDEISGLDFGVGHLLCEKGGAVRKFESVGLDDVDDCSEHVWSSAADGVNNGDNAEENCGNEEDSADYRKQKLFNFVF